MQKQLKQVAHWLKSSARKCYGHHHELVVVRYEIVISELQRIISILGRFVFISPITDGIFTGLDCMSNAAGVLLETEHSYCSREPSLLFVIKIKKIKTPGDRPLHFKGW